ncbi:hypothetical protein D9M69_680610 [compost metagenome]
MLSDRFVDPRQISGVVAAPCVLFDADGDRAERDHGLRRPHAEGHDPLRLFGDDGFSERTFDSDGFEVAAA